MKVNRLLANVCAENPEESKVFYTSLFDFSVDYDSDWFVHLISTGRALEIGIMQANHELIPDAYRGAPAGLYLTFVVDDVLSIFEKARKLGYKVVKEPELTFYGQKRLLLSDPGGVLIDVSSPASE